jgi:hydroxyquinol 1,2-dioxygenase
MRNIDEHTITEAVLERLDTCGNPRLKQVLSALVRHLHDFAREVELTEAEWMEGIRFLTATGQMCDDKRQEFILLSDTLGLSMLNVALNNARPAGATEATVFGPFHVPGAPAYPLGADIANGAPGERLYVCATVRGLDGEPVAGAMVDTWQADEDGFYDVQLPDTPLRGRGVLRSDERGQVYFRSILPVAYPVPTDGPVGQMLVATGRHPWRPAHVHFMIEAPGYETLITHVFRDGDPYLDSDVVFGVRSSLIGRFERHASGMPPFGPAQTGVFHTLRFDFVLNPVRKEPA